MKQLKQQSIKVSIITPVHNAEKYLRGCIESVLAQDYPNIEQVFVDNLSSDETSNILTEYKLKNPDSITIHRGKDSNVEEAWNTGIKLAHGEILSWLGADDLLLPEAISKVVSYFNSNPRAVFLYGECELINADGETIGYYPTAKFSMDLMLNRRNVIPCTSAFYKKGIFNQMGYVVHEGSDYELWLQIGEHYTVHYLNGEVLSKFRVHDEGLSSSGKNTAMILRRVYKASRKHGGSVFSTHHIIYRINSITQFLNPVMGFTYPFLKTIFRKFHPSVRVKND